MSIGLVDVHRFVSGKLKDRLLGKYTAHKIFTEADLQAYTWEFLRRFFRSNHPTKNSFRVLNKPFLRDAGIHPDMAIFKHGKPWVLFEIKERKELPARVARKERARLTKARKKLRRPRPKRGYLLYAIRYGKRKALGGPKGGGARYFFEVPIVLQQEGWSREKIKQWERERKKFSKYVSNVRD